MKAVSAKPVLDDLDRLIVAAVQLDPRASWSQIGKLVGTSETTAMRRVQRLRDSNALIITASPDAQLCGFGQPVLLYFRTSPGMTSGLAELLAKRSDVRYVAQITGRSDVMCELIAPDREYLADVIMRQLPRTGHFSSSRTDVVLKRFKTRDQWSRQLLNDESLTEKVLALHGDTETSDGTPQKLDTTDLRILRGLGSDGRRSYADLATELDVSETVVGRRIQALTASKQLTFVAMVDPAILGFTMEAILRVKVDLSVVDATAHAVAAFPEARYVAATSGDSELVIDAVFRDTEASYEFVTNKLGLISGIRDVEIDIVLESIKRDYHYPLFSRIGSARGHIDHVVATT
ncbi:Lrp/AsnC family transcriptional regulator [Cryobacterium sp. Hb1]|uniref:Lrp/AsnC family transcriptional regulator n=1 Tax=Cryobacterium sp. Hb1 TaxID=1259147 RepID=UPI00106ACE12|nr:Lrp/AsnC family transcriptional regulator [Cryobacterium sp. Hb1]TFD70472.1 Lrp/AsnC family transcriptional regulator [Cryobacterium sp. Hb1]